MAVDTVAAVARVVVGVAFVVAGGSKLAMGPEWPVQARSLGAPSWSIGPLPWLELAVGAALVVGLGGPVTGLVALALLLAFTGVIVSNLRRGHRPPCACFGAWSSAPIGWRHVARNAALGVGIAVAVIVELG